MQSHLQDLKQRQAVLRILIFTFVTAMIWIGISIFRTQQVTETSPELLRLAEPLNPNINLEVVSRIEQKKGYQSEELTDFPLFLFTEDETGKKTVIVDSPSYPYQPPATPAIAGPETETVGQSPTPLPVVEEVPSP